MKKNFLLLSLSILLSVQLYAKKWIIVDSGFSFSPSDLTVTKGDTIVFNIASFHNVLEVSQSTWDANGNSGLSGGFSLGFGGGTILTSTLTTGTHLYVCEPHASGGMKGKFTVQTLTETLNKVEAPSLKLFPIPSKDVLNFEADENLVGKSFVIVNLLGQKLLESTFTNNQSIDLKDVPAGINFIQFGDANKTTIKFIKN